MDLNAIQAFRGAHKQAARRAKLAGYDILYVYAAHDLSILSHFLSTRTNQRVDAYGGSLENRVRLLREVLEDTLEVAAGEQAVALRFSVAAPGSSKSVSDDAEGRDVVEALAEMPDLWDVNLSGWPADSESARFADEGFQLPYTDFVKTVTSKPVVGVGRFTSPDLMVSMIKRGQLDLIGAARPSIADPFLPSKIKAGQIEDIRECIGCNICVSMDSYGLPIRCTQNPTISEEWRSSWHPEAPAISTNRRSHLIVGSGPAGLECAVTLLRAGQKVTVAEARDEAGGRVTREARLPGLASWVRVRDYRLHQLSQSVDAELFLSSELGQSDIAEFDADTITLATGAMWRADGVGSTNFNGVEWGTRRILTPDDIMDGMLQDAPPTDFLVYDDDHFYMASVIAEVLGKAGHKVTYATPLPTIATWTDNTLDQGKIIERLVELDVALCPNRVLTPDVQLKNTLTGKQQALRQNDIVFVGARSPRNELHKELESLTGLGEIFSVGDCVAPGIIQAAVLSGHETARRILAQDRSVSAKLRDQISF